MKKNSPVEKNTSGGKRKKGRKRRRRKGEEEEEEAEEGDGREVDYMVGMLSTLIVRSLFMLCRHLSSNPGQIVFSSNT